MVEPPVEKTIDDPPVSNLITKDSRDSNVVLPATGIGFINAFILVKFCAKLKKNMLQT